MHFGELRFLMKENTDLQIAEASVWALRSYLLDFARQITKKALEINHKEIGIKEIKEAIKQWTQAKSNES